MKGRKAPIGGRRKPKTVAPPVPADEAVRGYCPSCMCRRYLARGQCLTCGFWV